MLSILPKEKQVETKKIEQELLSISKYRSTVIANRFGTILILIVLITSTIITRESIRAYYVLIANALLPLFLSHVFRPKKEQNTLLLPHLAKRYNYHSFKYTAYSISFLFVCLLLYLWNHYELTNAGTRDFLSFAPIIILFIMVSIRIFGIPYYKRKLHLMLLFSRF